MQVNHKTTYDLIVDCETVPFADVMAITALLELMGHLTPAQKRLAVRTAIIFAECAE